MKGYAGSILHVNLSTGDCTIEHPDEKFYRKYVGGSLLGGYYLLKNVAAKTDPLSPDNMIVFSVGPATGAAMSGASRHAVTTKSPLTNTIAGSEAGGFWGPELKFSGFDAVVIRGKASRPVYLWIHDGEVEIKPADNLWGKLTKETQSDIRKELGDDKIRVACIGPGGENLVRYANITNELAHFNGRNGMGAVMGSKNLKAIAVRGTKKPVFHDEDVIKNMSKEGARIVREDPFAAAFKELGTNQNFEWHTPMGGVPTRNWSSGTFEGVEKINAKAIKDTVLKRSSGCWACSLNCKRVVEITEAPYVDPDYGGPEYETTGMCGSNLGIDNLATISKINEICNKYAIDTISCGGTVGFTMDCYEHGIITQEELGGLDLRFGNEEAALQVFEMIGKAEGIGKLLGQGTARVAEVWGPESQKLAVHVKGKEFPAHMPQVKASLSLAYGCLSSGPDHVSSAHDGDIGEEPISYRLRGLGFDQPQDSTELNEEKSRLFWVTQCGFSAIDSLSICQFIFGHWTMFDLNQLVDLVNAATGWNTSLYELMQIGQRRIQLFRAFSILFNVILVSVPKF
jgi:aldehyde:ferredoxin oxidoreductase